MNIFNTTVQAVVKRPSIIVIIGLLMLAAAIFNAFIPLVAMLVGIVNMTGGGFLESILSLLQMLIDPANIKTVLISIAVLSVVVSAAAGMLVPGFLLIVDNSVTKGAKGQGLLVKGIRSYFFRFFLMTLKTSLLTVLLVIFMLVASVPAIIVTRAVISTKQNLILAAVFIDLVTAGVFFMCLSFYRAYLYMWYVAASSGAEKPFKTGKAVADRKFWRIAMGLFCFDIVFTVAIYLIYSSDSQLMRYASGWIFATAYFTTLAIYLIRLYKES